MLRISMSSGAARSSEAKDPRLIWISSLVKNSQPRPLVMERLLSPSLDSTLPGGTSPRVLSDEKRRLQSLPRHWGRFLPYRRLTECYRG